MNASLSTAGELLAFECDVPWLDELIIEGAAGEIKADGAGPVSVRIVVEKETTPFRTASWEPLTRGAWMDGRDVVVENVCTSGLDLLLQIRSERPTFTFRWRPPARDRLLARLMRSRFHLLARAVLLQYPALWWAGTRGRVPLHASASATIGATTLLTAASGVGRSTLLAREVAHGGRATGDNLAVGDGTTVWGLVEPMRLENGSGRRMPHGRQETAMADREQQLVPDTLVIMRRADSEYAAVAPVNSALAARALTTSTYMAGELRRYWALAATLAAGSNAGPAHPAIEETSSIFASRLPCFTLTLGRKAGPGLAELLAAAEAAA